MEPPVRALKAEFDRKLEAQQNLEQNPNSEDKIVQPNCKRISEIPAWADARLAGRGAAIQDLHEQAIASTSERMRHAKP